MAPLRLIINGDDFGRTVEVNEGILRAHEQGVLTSASLMVTGAASARAAALARARPALAVGLHAVIIDGAPALPSSRLPHLLGGRASLPADPFVVGLRAFFSPAVRAELRAELRAQCERFAETGLSLAHVDGHYLFHMHPTVFPILVELAETFGAAGIRLPREDLRLTLRLDAARPARKATWRAVYAILCRLGERRLRRSTLVSADRVYGLLMSGRMHEAFVAGLVRAIPADIRSAEIYTHPCTGPALDPEGPNPGDLAALTSATVEMAVRERGALLTSYPDLRAAKAGGRL